CAGGSSVYAMDYW
nr:immunoglobulin heavy chain junction region [Mus musculus]